MKPEADKTLRFFVSAIGLILIALVLRELDNIFIPLLIAYFLFYVFSPLNHFLEKRKVPLIITIIIDLTILFFAGWIVSAFLFESFKKFGEELPYYAERLNGKIADFAVSVGITDPFFTSFSIEGIIAEIDYGPMAEGIFSSTFSVLGTILFVIFFFIFVVSGQEKMYDAMKKRFAVRSSSDGSLSPGEVTDSGIALTFSKITSQIQKYLISKFLINLAAGLAGFILLWLIGLDFAVIWGVFIFLFNFIPAIGSAVALILPVVMSLIQFESTGLSFAVLLIVIAVQSLFFNVIEPAVIGRRLNLNPLVILIAVLIWGYIWGIIGMLFAVPLTAIIKIIISNSESKDLRFFADLMSQE